MKNFFKLFNIEKKFAIDVNLLEQKYLELQVKFHPDSSSSDLNQIAKSMDINEGYKILSDDFLRGCHLLQLEKIDLINDDFAIKPDKSMLAEILELQEHISTLENKTIIENLIRQIKQTVNDLIELVSDKLNS